MAKSSLKAIVDDPVSLLSSFEAKKSTLLRSNSVRSETGYQATLCVPVLWRLLFREQDQDIHICFI